ncbi:hypothetical protein LSCM1_01902 [Leishmania martiniquensis]|uniref:Uncharacterized protein n=1 Tax=Leishmania martiniquensis TaxID=1580590 RepID=A0A836G9G4_9TRYP|nr:hypothetical protein LSCM1_01902 [Leishmania martiniquensis]
MTSTIYSPGQSGNIGIVEQPQSSLAGSAGSPLVRFSLLYRLRHHAHSVTARNSASPQRAGSRPSPSRAGERCDSCTAHMNDTSQRERAAAASSDYSTPPHRSSRPTSTELFARLSPSSVALSPSPATNTDVPLLSTMDKRELSKVIVRDAVFGRLLDLVPSRQHIQIAVWTLSPYVIQIDGAVTVCAMPRDAHNSGPVRRASRRAASRGGSSAYEDVESMRDIVRLRVGEIVTDAHLFACLLQPYLGDVGCRGDVIQAFVDTVG